MVGVGRDTIPGLIASIRWVLATFEVPVASRNESTPKPIRSPNRTSVGPLTRWPLTNVPFDDPRSSRMIRSPVRFRRA